MSAEAYDALAFLYDYLQKDLPVPEWADYVDRLVDLHLSRAEGAKSSPVSLCDLGCGTGAVSVELAKRGYDVQGIDYSELMLNAVLEKADEAGTQVFLSCQDIRVFALAEPVDVCTCQLDTVNHLTGKRDLERLFRSVHRALKPGGIFIFDIVTPEYLEFRLGNEFFYNEGEDFSLFWQNHFSPKRGMSTSEITLFLRTGESGLYRREEIVIREKVYSVSAVQETAQRCDLQFCGLYGELSLRKPGRNAERVFFVLANR